MTETNSCPVPIDVQDFLFKQASIGQICDGLANIPISSNLIAVDTRRALLYVGHENKLLVLQPANDSRPEWKLELDLPDRACRVQMSCDCSLLAVTFGRPSALIYAASSIKKHTLDVLHEIRLSASAGDILVSDLKWNPAIPDLLCSVTSDHTIGCFQVGKDIKTGVVIVGMERIPGVEALCVSWSPKGKQLVVGCKNGDIIQLKPELKPARSLSGPKPSEGVVISILWVSNYQFCACYYLAQEQRVSVMIVDAPKGVTAPKFTNYEDVTYGTGSSDNLYYYFEHVPEWGLIIAASSHSSEVAVLGSSDNGATWTIWQMVEGGAVQLPLDRRQGLENYPVGMAVDRSPTARLPWTAESTLPNPMPILRILVTSGQLCSYHMVNLRLKAPDICSPPAEIIPPPPALPRPSIGPDMSFNLPSGATSTPRTSKTCLEAQPKISSMAPAEVAAFPSQVKNAGFSAPPEIKTGGLFTAASVKTNLFQDAKNTPINPQIKATLLPQQPRAQVERQVTTEAAAPAKEPPPAYRPPEEVKPVAAAAAAAAKEMPVYDDALCLRAYLDEQCKFEEELRSKLDLPPSWQCGTDEERERLVKKTAEIDEFLRELKDATSGLASDIAYLKALLLQSFAWLEESKSKNDNLGGRARAAEGTKLADLQRLYYYTQSQLVQATKVLDLEWAEGKNRELARIKLPSLEVVYQSLVRHGQIIAQERKNVEELSKKWRSLCRGGGGGGGLSGLDRSMASLTLSRSTSSALLVSDTAIDLRCKLIAANTRNFSREKQTRLRDLLAETAPMIVRAVRPSAVQDRLEATLSALAAHKPIEAAAAASKARTPKSAQQRTPDSTRSKAHNPLSSLDNLVSGIGGGSALGKSPTATTLFAAPSKAQSTQAKAKENVSFIQGLQQQQQQQQQQQPQQSAAINKPFAKLDTISFGTPQKPPEQQQQQQQQQQASNDKSPENAKFPMFPANTFGRLGSPEALSGAAAGGASAMTTLATVSKSTFSFSSTTAPPPTPQNFAAPKLDNASVFKFSSGPQQPAATAGSLDLSSLNFGSRSGLTITPVSDAKAAEPTAAAPATFAFGKASASQQAPIFRQSATTPAATLPPAMSSLFGKSASPATSSAAASTSPEKSSATVTTSTAAVTASTPSTPSSAFGTSSLFGGLAAATPTFSFTPASTQAATAPSTAATTTAAGISFGNLSSTVPSSSFAGILGATSAMSFGTPSTAAATSITPAFGTTPTTNIFASPASTTAATEAATAIPSSSITSIFGKSSGSAASPSGANIFGGATAAAAPAASTAASSALTFGSTPAAATTSIFGGQTTVSSENSFFSAKPAATTTATPAAAPAASVFGSTASTPTASIFGSTAAPVFGATTTTTQASNVFGKSTPPSTSIFGSSSTTTPGGGSIFGGASPAPAFGATAAAAAAATTAAPPTTPSAGIFGSAPATGSIFGGGSAATPATASSVFGANTTPTASMFGAAAATPSSTPGAAMFGAATVATSPQAPAGNIFGAAVAASPPAAGASSIFGGSPALGAAGTAFGGSTFGGAPAFGGKPVFGSPGGNPAFGSGFGSSPSFGGAPSPGFGNAPVFGSTSPAAANTSPSKVFGSNTFEALGAQQGGLSFGSLAQSTDTQKPAFGGSSSFSSWR